MALPSPDEAMGSRVGVQCRPLAHPKMASGDRKVSAVAKAWPGEGIRRGILVASWGLAPYPEPLAALMGAGGACWPIGLRKSKVTPGLPYSSRMVACCAVPVWVDRAQAIHPALYIEERGAPTCTHERPGRNKRLPRQIQ